MKSEELIYVESRMTTWDWIRFYSFMVPATLVVTIIVYGIIIGGYDRFTYLLTGSFTVSLLLAVVLRMTVGKKIARLRAEFDLKNRKI